MNFKKSRPLLLIGAALVAATISASSASAQQADNCALGAGTTCEDAFGAANNAPGLVNRPTRSSATEDAAAARMRAHLGNVQNEQERAVSGAERAAAAAIKGIQTACKAVSPNKPTDACP